MSLTILPKGCARHNLSFSVFPKKWLLLASLIIIISLPSFAQKIEITTGAHLVMKGRPFLVIHNAGLNNDGIFTSDSGTVKISGTADTSIAHISGTSSSQFNNLTINKTSNGVSLRSIVGVKDSLNISAGILHSNENLLLLSDSNKTATFTELPVDGDGNATAYLTGKVSVQKHMAAWRAWRLVSAPVKSVDAPTINQSWQEGVTTASGNPNPNPGYGVYIIGGSEADGYDQGLTNSHSIKVYDSTSNSFVGLPAGGTHLPISNYPGYFLFVRGDRSHNITQSNVIPVQTKLRMKGEIKIGKQQVTVHSKGLTLLGNPYPAAINFESLTKNNVRNQFYTWDPFMDGNYGMGAWVTVSWNGSAYETTPSASNISTCIPSGAAVFVQAEDTLLAASLVIHESDKANCNNVALFARGEQITGKLRTSFLERRADGSKVLMDGLITSFDDMYSNEIDRYDVPKMATKYVGQKRNNQLLAVERRQAITEMDTIFLQLNQLGQRNYEWQFVFTGMEGQSVEAMLKDNFSSTLNNRLLSLSDTNFIQFNVNSNVASGAANRFMIVFKRMQVLPVSFHPIKAAENAAGILVQWETEQEINIKEYVLEKSINGTDFYPINTQVARGNGSAGKNVYQYQDNAAAAGNQFYRVKAVEANGATKQSNTVVVNIAKSQSGMIVFPNPVTGNVINLQTNVSAVGMYTYRLTNSNGQVITKGTFQVQRPNQQLQLPVSNTTPKGIYQLEIKHSSTPAVTHKIIIQ